MHFKRCVALASLIAPCASAPALAASATLVLSMEVEATCDVGLQSGFTGRNGMVDPEAAVQTVAELNVDCASEQYDLTVTSGGERELPSQTDFALTSATTDSLIRYAIRVIGAGGKELMNTLESDFSTRLAESDNEAVLEIDIMLAKDVASKADSADYSDTVIFTVTAAL